MAFDDANKGNAVPGYKFDLLVLDDGTATAGQYDPAQAATNARKMVADKDVVAAIGPQMSGAGKAMTPILSQGGLATITPSSTNPDITSPKFAEQYPSGRQADLFPHRHHRRVPGAEHGELPRREAQGEVGLRAGRQRRVRRRHGRYAFRSRRRPRASRSLGRDRLDPKAADYSAILTKIKSLEPGGDLLRRRDAGRGEARQAGLRHHSEYHQGRRDGMYSSDLLNGAGFPAVEGWYTSIAAPHLVEDTKAAQFIAAFKAASTIRRTTTPSPPMTRRW